MAYYSNEDEEQLDPDAQQGQSLIGGESSQISGQGVSAGAAGAPTAVKSSTTPDNPGNFVGIQQYIQANKPQAEQLGTQAADIVTKSTEAARQSIGNLGQAASQQIKGQEALDQGVIGQIGSGAEQLSQEQKDQAKKVAAAQYQGPVDYTGLGESYSEAAKRTQEAQDRLKQVETEEGRTSLVSGIGDQQRSKGVNVFDAALLQAGGGRQKLADVAAQNKDISGLLGGAEQDIQQKIGQAQSTTQASQKQAQDAINTALAQWKAGFAPKVDLARQALIDQQNRVMSDLGGADRYALTPETMALLGLGTVAQDARTIQVPTFLYKDDPNHPDEMVLTPQEIAAVRNKTYGVDLNKFITQADPTGINAANVASANDYARYLALADLAGDTSGILQAGNEQLAGTAPKLKADKEALGKEIDAAKDSYRSQQLASYTNDYNSNRGPAQLFSALQNSSDPELKRLAGEKFDWVKSNHTTPNGKLSFPQIVEDMRIANAYRRQYDRTGNKDFLNMSQPTIDAWNKLVMSGKFDNLLPSIKKQQ